MDTWEILCIIYLIALAFYSYISMRDWEKLLKSWGVQDTVLTRTVYTIILLLWPITIPIGMFIGWRNRGSD